MGAKRVHVKVRKNSLSFKKRRLEFPKLATSFLVYGFKKMLLAIHLLPPLYQL